MKPLSLLALFLLLFTGCGSIDLRPIESCVVGNASSSGDLVDKKELSPGQLAPLSAWFASLRGDWKFEVVDMVPSGLVLVLNHKRGRTTQANLRAIIFGSATGSEFSLRPSYKSCPRS